MPCKEIYERDKEKHRAAARAWYAKNKERCSRTRKLWAKNNPDKIKAAKSTPEQRRKAMDRVRHWQGRNPAKAREYKRAWERSNPAACRAKCARRHASKLRATPPWANLELIELIYAEAVHRGLEVDHIVPLQGKTVCGLHVHTNMQLLTKSANASKRNRWADD